MENGDLNWIVAGKFLAFAGPRNARELSPEGYYTLTPEDYIPYFRKSHVDLIVRLNRRCYDEAKFVAAGMQHLELYYLDGSVPSNDILQAFLQACESTPGAVAVHCKAGLGRTGTCIGCYLMKHYRFTAAEAIGWIRVCRPGSIIGPQQHFLQEMEQTMWRQGDLYRQQQQEAQAAAGSTKTSSSSSASLSIPCREGQPISSVKNSSNGAGLVATGGGDLDAHSPHNATDKEAAVDRAGAAYNPFGVGQGESLLHRRALQCQEQHRRSP